MVRSSYLQRAGAGLTNSVSRPVAAVEEVDLDGPADINGAQIGREAYEVTGLVVAGTRFVQRAESDDTT
jgi:hypothetical protein